MVLLHRNAECFAATAPHAVSLHRGLVELGRSECADEEACTARKLITRSSRKPPNHYGFPLPYSPVPEDPVAGFSAPKTMECEMRNMQCREHHHDAIVRILQSTFHIQYSPEYRYPLITMTTLTAAQIRHIAKLARLHIDEAEVEKYVKELTSILTYIEKLKEVDTTNVEPTAQVTGPSNALRPDAIDHSSVARDVLLATSPLPVVEDQIETPSAHA
jgi:aspartyl-tRNA(Asn)/glutamyl-tRNA(Gln) amidotransferase subunit C